ncbi:glycerol kinase GlpK [Pokkaliibacter sp. CJK22405]|uniref:glycerol kinase GlpK n=1 Tax=Pokkaliibacter sp. CJK22405 TaxID=3384615 RepID=UPI003985188F
MTHALLALDQGTTSSRAIIFSAKGEILATAQQEFPQHYPQDGWIEHDPADLWQTTLNCARDVLKKAELTPADILAAGITNQRETTLIWDRQTGEPIYPAIVWQDRRTGDWCRELRDQGKEDEVTERTGLIIDPYFSATKIRWILDHVEGAMERAKRGELAFGTVDSFLIWRFTKGKRHVTDATNASRTLLFNIHEQCWDESLLTLFGVPESLLPEVLDNAADFGQMDEEWLGGTVDICGVAGDQQAALFGQACFEKGMAKSTYGTGCFMIANTGDEVLASSNRLLSTVGYRLKGKTTYALEGSIFVAGAAIQWLRDGIRLIENAGDTEKLARSTGIDHGVYLVPAFTGLGAPYWDPKARGAMFGLTRDTGIAEIVTAGLQSVCFQSRDLLTAMDADGVAIKTLRVDGGMIANDWLLQHLADILRIEVERPHIIETTALGAACLAGLHKGMFASLEEVATYWQQDKCVGPELDESKADKLYQGWLEAVHRIMSEE